jgi:DnaJ-class molecular chaperone
METEICCACSGKGWQGNPNEFYGTYRCPVCYGHGRRVVKKNIIIHKTLKEEKMGQLDIMKRLDN